MFKNVIVRRPSKSMIEGITSSPELGKVDYELALKQHDNYIEALKSCGVEVTILDADERYPDSCFVEDTAVVTKNCVIICNPAVDSRNKEVEEMKVVMKKFFNEEQIECITYPGTIEGGDIMMVGKHFYIGLSARTNEEGARQFIEKLEKHGYTGSVVELNEMLHLKTGLAYLEKKNLLISGEFIEKEEFKNFNKIIVNEDESYSANCIWVNDTVIVPKGYEETKNKIESLGYRVVVVDTSEYRKLDGGLSCLSLRF